MCAVVSLQTPQPMLCPLQGKTLVKKPVTLNVYKQKTPLMGVVSYGTNYFCMYAILKAQNQSVVLHFLQISFFKP